MPPEKNGQGQVTNTVSIRERATSVEDHGEEMAGHRRFTVATDIKVCFCVRQNPWQQGSDENTHGLLLQDFLKGTDLQALWQARLNAVVRQLNERP